MGEEIKKEEAKKPAEVRIGPCPEAFAEPASWPFSSRGGVRLLPGARR
jgi:hypothetical protein